MHRRSLFFPHILFKWNLPNSVRCIYLFMRAPRKETRARATGSVPPCAARASRRKRCRVYWGGKRRDKPGKNSGKKFPKRHSPECRSANAALKEHSIRSDRSKKLHSIKHAIPRYIFGLEFWKNSANFISTVFVPSFLMYCFTFTGHCNHKWNELKAFLERERSRGERVSVRVRGCRTEFKQSTNK